MNEITELAKLIVNCLIFEQIYGQEVTEERWEQLEELYLPEPE